MSTWFTSDLHFTHKLVAEHRGFEDDIEGHDMKILSNWDSQVKQDDVVWVLGDLTLRNPSNALRALAMMPGRKHFIAGNHDPCHPMHREYMKWTGKFLEVFETVQPFARQKWAGYEFLLSHFPYRQDRGPIRYSQYRLADEGMWLIHGHTHSQVHWNSEYPREIHVGMDAWNMGLVHLDQVLSIRKSVEEVRRGK